MTSELPWWRCRWRLGDRSVFRHDFRAADAETARLRVQAIEQEWEGRDRLRGGRLSRLVRP